MIASTIRRTFATTGKLYTWGVTTYGWGRPLNDNLRVPGQVEGIADVKRVATGPYHIVFATTDNTVYSCGLGSNGRLGLGKNDSVDQPQIVTGLNNLKIKKLAAGRRHSMALTQSGEVYQWGYVTCGYQPSSYIDMFKSIFKNRSNESSPRLVSQLTEKVLQIAAGDDISLALGESGKVYGWGDNTKLIDQHSHQKPAQLEQINYFLHSHHLHVTKMKSSGKNAFFLLDDGRIYAIGQNNGGVFGTRKNPRILIDRTLNSLTKIIDEDLHGQKITNFKVSSNSLIFITEKGSVYYSGMELKGRPEKFPVKAGTAKYIFATEDTVGVIDNDGRIGFINDPFIDNVEKIGDVYVSRDEAIKNAVKIGGSHKLKFALVAN